MGLTREEMQEAIRKGISYPYEPIRVMQDVPAKTVVVMEEQRYQLPGVIVEMEEVREYPQGSLASHIVGYMAPISRAFCLPGLNLGTIHLIMWA